LNLDRRLMGLAKSKGYVYTRYADDLSFSSKRNNEELGNVIFSTYEIILNEKLYPNYSKTKVYRKGHRKEVTGIVINEKLNINRKWIRILRATIHHFIKSGFSYGPEGEKEHNQLLGKLAYLKMVNPEKFLVMVEQLKKIR
jgi:RNA-directed DNA polymerase